MEQQPQELDIRRSLLLIYKRRHLAIAVAAAIMTAALAACFLMKPVYEAKTVVLIERNFTNQLLKDITVTPSLEDRLRSLGVILKSRGLVAGVLQELGIDLAAMQPEQVEGMIAGAQRRTNIDLEFSRAGGGNMDAFTVSFRDEDPNMAEGFVNRLVRRYIGENLHAQRDEVSGASSFLLEQMEFFKGKIAAAENDLRRMRSERGIAARTRLASLQRKERNLLMQYTENHPEVARVRGLIDELEREIAKQQRAAGNADDGGGADLMANRQRELDAYKKIYEDLVASLGRSEVSTHAEVRDNADTFRVLEPAVVPTRPVSPNRVKILLLGLAAGVAGGIGVVLLLDSFDESVKSLDVLRKFGPPVLAVIPSIRNAADQAKQKRRDAVVYGFSGAYLTGFLIILAREFLG